MSVDYGVGYNHGELNDTASNAFESNVQLRHQSVLLIHIFNLSNTSNERRREANHQRNETIYTNQSEQYL